MGGGGGGEMVLVREKRGRGGGGGWGVGRWGGGGGGCRGGRMCAWGGGAEGGGEGEGGRGVCGGGDTQIRPMEGRRAGIRDRPVSRRVARQFENGRPSPSTSTARIIWGRSGDGPCVTVAAEGLPAGVRRRDWWCP